jgi:hypothetical protein
MMRRLLALGLTVSSFACGGGSSGDASEGPSTAGASGGAGGAANEAGTSAGGTPSGAGGNVVEGGSAGTLVSGDASMPAWPKGAGTTKAATTAQKLGRPANFLIAFGNDGDVDDDSAESYQMGVDIRYLYFVNTPQGYGTSWAEYRGGNGQYMADFFKSCDKHGVVPWVTFYQMQTWGEGNTWGIQKDAFMAPYWKGFDLMLTKIAEYDKPVLVQMEPDFFGFSLVFTELYFKAGDATSFPNVLVSKYHPECADLGDTLAGLGKCWIRLVHQKAPKALIGFTPSRWGGEGKGPYYAAFLQSMGADQADVIFIETLDRDAGCFEDHTLPQCQRDGSGWYWGTLDFRLHYQLVSTLTQTLGTPAIWWQTPLGVPSDTPGGTKEHFRDNRVYNFFMHMDKLVGAGGVAAGYGVGSGDQTCVTTDGGQFKGLLASYKQNLYGLP